MYCFFGVSPSTQRILKPSQVRTEQKPQMKMWIHNEPGKTSRREHCEGNLEAPATHREINLLCASLLRSIIKSIKSSKGRRTQMI